MAIKIGSSSINSIYIGDTAVKSVYLGNELVYSNEPAIIIDDSYNYFVFDTNEVSGSTTVTLQKNRGGDTTAWDSITDWGDGKADTRLSHTYTKDGIYTVKTKYMINKETTGNSNTRKMLIKCLNMNKNMTSYAYAFHDCENLMYINATNFDTSNVTDMRWMFNYCISLTSLNLSSFSTSNVTNMDMMFASCFKLESVNLSSFNTSNVVNMNEMFYYCYGLTNLNLSNFSINNTTTTDKMFYQCSKLTIDNIIMTNCNDETKTKIQNALAA